MNWARGVEFIQTEARRRPPGLLAAPCPRTRIRKCARGNELQRDVAPQLLVVCPIHIAHRAGAELLDDAILAERLSDEGI